MSDVVRLHGLGAAVDVHCRGAAGSALATALREAWSRCLVPHDPGLEPRAAEAVEASLDDPSRLAIRMMLTTQEVTRALIGARAGELLMVHAGAASDPVSGESVVYVARGGTGKTTLSRVLGQRLGYVTDETVGIGADGAVHPYPKPLSVRRADEPTVKDELSPDSLGLLPAPPRPVLSRLVLLDRRPGWAAAEVEEVGLIDAVLALAEQSSSLPALPRPLHRLADLVDAVGPVLRVRYAESADAADLLRQARVAP